MHTRKTSFLLTAFLLLLQFAGFAQDSSIVQWKGTGKKIAEGQYELHFTGTIKSGWHLYAKTIAALQIEGVKINFSDSSIKKEGEQVVTGNFKTINDQVFAASTEITEGIISVVQKISLAGAIPSKLKAELLYNVANNETLLPEEKKVEADMEGGVDVAVSNRILIKTIDIASPIAKCGDTVPQGKNIWQIFLIGFLGGLIALLTPCVFPMIPLTVSFFTNKSSRRRGIINAFIYGFFIFLIYVLLSVPFYFLPKGNEEILNSISTSPWLNIIFFAVFIVFALSFFGLYEITLPSSVANRADAKSNTGTILGIFFMALTLAIVSFSCTGPILGSLLVGALDGGAINLTAGLAGFGLSLALPFALFALFPQLLSSLPKSGGWLKEVKVVLGFIELAMAIKFISNADLTQHWGIIKREIFIGFWVLCGLCTTLYLLNVPPFKQKYPVKFSKTKRFFTAFFAVVTLYLIPGVTNTKYAKLSFISGFPPPYCYSIYDKPYYCDEPLKDYEEAVKLAKEKNKPILIDFTGWNCVNCRKMEENVWTKPDVKNLMDKFILVSLYVDDRQKLPAAKQFTYKLADGTTKEIVTVGDKWATFETENFKNNAQPLYALITPDEKLINNPVGYTPDPKAYQQWLQCGLDAFERSKK